AEAELARALIERCRRDHLAKRSLLQTEGARLVRRDRTAQLAPELLQLLIVAHAELLNRDLCSTDLGNRGNPETAENIADAPDPEADNQKPDHRSHDDLAEPIGGGFSQTSKHERVRSFE